MTIHNLDKGTPMADFLALLCPTCGAKLQVSKNTTALPCLYCGNAHTVNRQNGSVHLDVAMQGIQTSVDKTAAELAISRLTNELVLAKTEETAAIEAVAKYGTGNELAAPPVKNSLMSTREISLLVSSGVFVIGSILSSSSSFFFPICGSIALVFLILYFPARSSRINKERKSYEAQLQAYTATLQMHQATLQSKQDFAATKSQRVVDLQRSLERNRQIAKS
jgi:predicted RNA-binding Zn-ribbon protein involved in translation (DUF1610 family)